MFIFLRYSFNFCFVYSNGTSLEKFWLCYTLHLSYVPPNQQCFAGDRYYFVTGSKTVFALNHVDKLLCQRLTEQEVHALDLDINYTGDTEAYYEDDIEVLILTLTLILIFIPIMVIISILDPDAVRILCWGNCYLLQLIKFCLFFLKSNIGELIRTIHLHSICMRPIPNGWYWS